MGIWPVYDLNELDIFVAVMDEGGLTPVANRLGVPKSTLSRRISQLEQRIGQPLLLRQSNRMLATEAGRLFQNYCRQMLALAEQSRLALDELKGSVSGDLKLYIHNAFERGWLPEVLDSFVRRHPQVRLQIQQALTAPASEQLLHGDLCLWLGPCSDHDLRCERLGEWTVGVYASPAYLEQHGTPCRPAELSRHAWVDVLRGDGESMCLLHSQQTSECFLSPASRLRASSLVLQADAIVRGQGIGLLPDCYASRYEAAHPGSVQRCLPEWQAEPLPVSLLYSHGQPPRKLMALIDCLRAAVPPAWRG